MKMSRDEDLRAAVFFEVGLRSDGRLVAWMILASGCGVRAAQVCRFEGWV